ncbi:MAG: tetratricopeptide repeat protein [Cyclobacteriaceae bacterium]
MSNSDNHRITQLKSFIEEDKNDPFPLYALALEYVKHNQKAALNCFHELLDRFPKYLPTYYHAAQFFIELGNEEFAEKTFKDGISLAQSQDDPKALQELKAAYFNFQMDLD